VPWSAEHHAASKTKKANGTWKAKPGGDKAALIVYERQFAPVTVANDIKVDGEWKPVDGATFMDLMTLVGALTSSGKVTPKGLQALIEQVGASNLTELAQNGEKIPALMGILGAVQ
jgi:hypothetical protein